MIEGLGGFTFRSATIPGVCSVSMARFHIQDEGRGRVRHYINLALTVPRSNGTQECGIGWDALHRTLSHKIPLINKCHKRVLNPGPMRGSAPSNPLGHPGA